MKQIKRNQFVTCLLLFSASFYSCQKTHHHDDPKPEEIKVEIQSPQVGIAYGNGDSVKMNFLISAPANLHGYEVHISRLFDKTEVYSFEEDVHEKELNIHKIWVNDGACESEMNLQLIVFIDHDGNKISKNVKFYCHKK